MNHQGYIFRIFGEIIEMETIDIKVSNKNLLNQIQEEEGILTITEVVNSLTKAVSILQTIKQIEGDSSVTTIEEDFPKEGLDFYKATKSYEISLIKHALQITKGHQTNAAKLLNLKLSTLNSLIKRYKIHY